MNSERYYSNGCSEEFAELCALSTSGELTAEELATLDEHVAGCDLCAALLREYTSLAHFGIAKLAAELEPEIKTPLGYSDAKAEERFVAALRAAQPGWRQKLQKRVYQFPVSGDWRRMKHPAFLFGTAAAVLISIIGAFQLGQRMTQRMNRVSSHSEPASVVPLTAPDGEKTPLKTELVAAQASLQEATARSADLETQFANLSDAKKSLLAQIQQLKVKSDADSASLALAIKQSDGLQQQLNETSSAMTRARDDLNRAQQDRQGAQFRAATLEAEVKDLRAELTATSNSAGNDEKFLVADRDIRELMGARQLYISDVFDVQNNGERSKPFGRVFYTKGRSLIFYAFDLQAQPGYRETKAFQAWGKLDNSSDKPISLGIFYLDNEQNRRWVVKSDNPNALAQINAVFVTVEPHGGSKTPTSKPFLEAYLHSIPPNHP